MGGWTELGKEIKAFSIPLVNLMSQEFYYNSCRRAGWRDHSNSRRNDRAVYAPHKQEQTKQQLQVSQIRIPRTLRKPRGMMAVTTKLDLPGTGLPISLHKS